MYIVLVYDAGPKRGQKILKYLRQNLTWVQNSVFEGECTKSKYSEIKYELKRMIDKNKDSIIIYSFDSMKYNEREIMGIEKNSIDTIL